MSVRVFWISTNIILFQKKFISIIIRVSSLVSTVPFRCLIVYVSKAFVQGNMTHSNTEEPDATEVFFFPRYPGLSMYACSLRVVKFSVLQP